MDGNQAWILTPDSTATIASEHSHAHNQLPSIPCPECEILLTTCFMFLRTLSCRAYKIN